MKNKKMIMMVGVLLAASMAHADGVVHIPAPVAGYGDPANPDDGITFGNSYLIAPSLYGLTISAPEVRFDGAINFEASSGTLWGTLDGLGIQGYTTTIKTDAIELMNFDGTSATYLSASGVPGDLTLMVMDGVHAMYYLRVGEWWDSQSPRVEMGLDATDTYLAFGPSTALDTYLRRDAAGVLAINGQNIVTQNVLTNYVTLNGVQTLTNKSLDAGQITGSLTAAKGGTGLTSYTTGDLVYAASSTTLGKLPAGGSGNVLLSGSSPSWGKVGLTTHVDGVLPVTSGGTGAASLTGILKGNGTGAVSTVAAPGGALVGTTDSQTLENKTLVSPTVSGGISGGTYSLDLSSEVGINLDADTAVTGSFTAGYGHEITGFAAVAFGEMNEVTADNAAAFGFGSQASGSSSMAIGDSVKANGFASLASGSYTAARAYASMALGRFNVEQGDADAWIVTDDLLTVGNGNPIAFLGPVVASNAMALHKNGKLRVADTVDAKGGFRTPPMGDLGMGTFTAGENPAALNAGLRYLGE